MASVWQNDTGKWTAQVNTNGKRRSRTFEKKVDAARWARGEEAASDKSGKALATAQTFGDVIAAYATQVGLGSRSKEGAIRHIHGLIGRTKLTALDTKAWVAFANARAEGGAGPATVGQDLTYCHTVLKTAGPLIDARVAEPLAALASARTVLAMTGTVARPEERKRRPTDAELILIRDHFARNRSKIPMWPIIQFAIASAMRLSEITRIEADGLNMKGRTILIRDRKHPRSKKGNDQVVPLLRGPVVIAGETIDAFALITAQLAGREAHGPIWDYDSRTISTSFTRAVRACKIVDLHFHDLRHDGVSRLFEDGYQIEQVSVVSGHQSWEMLRRYTQISAESLHRPDPAEGGETQVEAA